MYTDAQIARVCHEAIRALPNNPVPGLPWDHLPTAEQQLVIDDVDTVLNGGWPQHADADAAGLLVAIVHAMFPQSPDPGPSPAH